MEKRESFAGIEPSVLTSYKTKKILPYGSNTYMHEESIIYDVLTLVMINY